MYDAVIAMTSALDAIGPQRKLFRRIVRAAAAQDDRTRALVSWVYGLLPPPCSPRPDTSACERLSSLTALTDRLGQDSTALAALTANITAVPAGTAPHELTSTFAAEYFDMSGYSLARAQVIETQDLRTEDPSPTLLNEALRDYETEITGAAIRAFTLQVGSDRAGNSVQEILDASLRKIFVLFRTEWNPSDRDIALSAVRDAGSRPHLRLADVFDVATDSIWLADFEAYFPLFTFVFEALLELERSEQALAGLLARTRALLCHVTPEEFVARQDEQDVMLSGLLTAMTMPGGKITGIVEARRAAWTMREWYSEIRRIAEMVDAAADRLTGAINGTLAHERAQFAAETGAPPWLDIVGRADIERVARDVQETTELHVGLARLLVAEAALIWRRGKWPDLEIDIGILRDSVTSGQESVQASSASLSSGEYLRALACLADVRLPLLPAAFLGLKFHQDALAQARPLAVLVLWQQMAAARWAVMAATTYPRRRRSLAEAIYAEITEFQRTHCELLRTLGETLIVAEVPGMAQSVSE